MTEVVRVGSSPAALGTAILQRHRGTGMMMPEKKSPATRDDGFTRSLLPVASLGLWFRELSQPVLL